MESCTVIFSPRRYSVKRGSLSPADGTAGTCLFDNMLCLRDDLSTPTTISRTSSYKMDIDGQTDIIDTTVVCKMIAQVRQPLSSLEPLIIDKGRLTCAIILHRRVAG